MCVHARCQESLVSPVSGVLSYPHCPSLQDLENTLGSWDMYGQEEKKRYPDLQAKFFENATSGLGRREAMLGFLVGTGGASILVWGAKGSKSLSLPITKGPSKAAVVGPRGRI